MATAYEQPTLEETQAFLIALHKALFPSSNVGSTSSFHWKRLRVIAAAVTDLHAGIASAQSDVMPDTASEAYATRWGAIFGVTRKGATAARKAAALRVFGTPGSSVAAGDELRHTTSGLLFQITAPATIPGGGTFVDADVAGIDTGSQTRLAAGETLDFLAPPAGIQTKATLQLALDEDGDDQEALSEFRLRYLAVASDARTGGSQAEYVEWALELAGIAAAFCYPNRAGLGTVDVAALHTGSGAARNLTSGERDELLAHLKTKAPAQIAGTGGSLRVLTTTIDPKPIEVTVTPSGDPAWDFDYDDTGGAATITAYNAGTRTITFAVRPTTLKAGDRITVKGVATVQDGRQYVIEALGGGQDAIVQAPGPTVAFLNTDLAYAGGPLVDLIRDAIIAHVDGEAVYADDDGPIPAGVAGSRVGLKVLADGMGTANPAGVYGTWVGGLIRATLQKLAIYARGARNAAIVLPAADYEATDYAFPNDAQIGLVTWSSVIVRRG